MDVKNAVFVSGWTHYYVSIYRRCPPQEVYVSPDMIEYNKLGNKWELQNFLN